MIKKKVLVLFCVLFLILPVVHAVTITTESEGVNHKGRVSPYIVVTLLNQEPDPVEPGEMVEVRFKIENALGETLTDVEVELLPSYPFSMYSGPQKKNIGKLQASQTGADAAIVDFKLRVDDDAVEGDHELELKVKVAKDLYALYVENEFMIDVETVDAILEIDKVIVTPETMYPGNNGTLTLKLTNLDDTPLKNIHVKLEVQDQPVVPHQSTNEQWINRLSGGYTKHLTFPIQIDPNAAAGLYKIPVELSFLDTNGNAFNKSNTIGVSVGGKPDLRVYLRDKEVFERGTSGTIIVEIANPTPIDVHFLELEIEKSNTFTLLSANRYVYIGDVDTDDTETETFTIFVDKRTDEVRIQVTMSFQDPLRNEYQQRATLVLYPLSKGQLVRYGLVPSSTKFLVIIGIIIAGVGYYVWRRKKKK